jgi:DNA invertase Pin-like site-specific DNA recombinase
MVSALVKISLARARKFAARNRSSSMSDIEAAPHGHAAGYHRLLSSLIFIQPGTPIRSAIAERFKRSSCRLTVARKSVINQSTNVDWFMKIGSKRMASQNTGNFVAYYRVSTQRQGRSGLGLEAQQEAVRNYLNGGDWRLVGEFTEVESGKRKDRPKLAEALAACRVHGARLVLARLDRLARNAHFLLGLKEAGVEFVAADMPEANHLTVGIMALVAEHTAKVISDNTKAALKAAKARGVKLGGFRAGAKLTAKARQAGVKAVQARADARAVDLAPIVHELQAASITSLRGIADELNRRGIRTPRGCQWQAGQVSQLLARIGA